MPTLTVPIDNLFLFGIQAAGSLQMTLPCLVENGLRAPTRWRSVKPLVLMTQRALRLTGIRLISMSVKVTMLLVQPLMPSTAITVHFTN